MDQCNPKSWGEQNNEYVYPMRSGVEFQGVLTKDAKERVQRSCDRWRKTIRERLRKETCLSFVNKEHDRYVSVKVNVTDGIPEPFADIVEDYTPELLRLMQHADLLESGKKASGFMQDTFEEIFAIFPQLEITFAEGGDLKNNFVTVYNYFDAVLNELSELSFDEKFKAINTDILGTYDIDKNYIQIHWMPIILLARRKNIDIDHLTAVVLIHEMAHAFTHLGMDIDGKCWDTDAFANTDMHVTEGLAQFYTSIVSERLSEKEPGIKKAFIQLLQLQGGPYVEHLEWIKSMGYDEMEVIRTSMLEARRWGVTDRNRFKERMAHVTQELNSY